MARLTKPRGRAGTKGDGRRVKSKRSSPGVVLGNRVLDEGATGPANVWFNRRKVSALPRVENGKREGLCPNSDRRSGRVVQVFKVGFRHGRKMKVILPSPNKRESTRLDFAEESGRRLGFPEVDGEPVEVQEGPVEGVDVVLVVDVRVQLCGPFQRSRGRPGGGKVDQGKGDAVDVESGREELVEFVDGKRAIEGSGMVLLGGHCGLGERDAHQHHLDQRWTLSTQKVDVECADLGSGEGRCSSS